MVRDFRARINISNIRINNDKKKLPGGDITDSLYCLREAGDNGEAADKETGDDGETSDNGATGDNGRFGIEDTD